MELNVVTNQFKYFKRLLKSKRIGKTDINHINTYLHKSVILKHGGLGVVINARAFIGKRVVIGQNVTIDQKNGKCPIILDDVKINCNSVVIGDIVIGEGAVIGAGSVVLHDIPAYTTVAGNPARIIR